MSQRSNIPITVVVLTIFFFSITALLFSVGFQFPESYALPVEQDDYETDYWDFAEAISSPLDLDNISSTIRDVDISGETISLDEWYFNYASENVSGNTVRINSVLLKPSNTSSPTPTLLFLHGYGERYSTHIAMLRQIAAEGYIVMGIDHPGAGDSTGMPSLTLQTFLNVTDGPQSSNLYHSVWAAARSITFLETLPYVDQDAIVVSGDSMGAWTTFILAAKDSRVDGTIPMIAAGNLKNSITTGSLINSVIVPSYTTNSPEMQDLIRWLDPLPYARELTQPTLMLFGSADPFFPVVSMKDTVDAISAPLTLGIIPNWIHGVYNPWTQTIVKWLDDEFRTGSSLPSIDLGFEDRITVQGFSISVNASTTDATRAWVCWRSGEPGAVWLQSEMRLVNASGSQFFTYDIIPALLGKISFFVVVEGADSVSISSSIHVGYAGSFLIPVLLVFSGLYLLIIIKKGEWIPAPDDLIREFPYIVGMFLLVLGFFLPFITIRGRASLNVLQIIEVYGRSFFLSGWFLPTFALSICLILALSSYRHRFEIRTAGILWSPVLVSLIILFVVLYAIFGFFGSLILVDFGPGGPVFLGGMILMQLLDKTVRDRMEKRIEKVRDKVVDIRDTVLDVGEQIHDTAKDLGNQIQDRIEKELGKVADDSED